VEPDRGAPRPDRRGASRGPSRRAPSLARELIQGLLLQPELARSIALPRPDDGTAEGTALAALVDFCAAEPGTLSTAAVMQHFAQTGHDAVLSSALASAHDHALAVEQVEAQLREGAARWWQNARRAGTPTPPPEAGLSAEETERLRQLEIVRRGRSAGPPPDSET
jgi:hypothetical protein